jgi:hypothetical protein
VQGMNLEKFKKTLLINMTISKEAILTQGYQLPLKGTQTSDVSTLILFHTLEAYSSLGSN